MDLELGLTLTNHNPKQGFGFDLNKQWFEPKGTEGLNRLSQGHPSHDGQSWGQKRQKFEEEGLIEIRQKMLSMVSWNNKEPNEEEDDDDDPEKNTSFPLFSFTKNHEKDQDNGIKGWPPIQSWRKKFMPSYQPRQQAMNRIRGSNSMFIKVKMEGVAIGRKINLRCFDSYQDLFHTLIAMFAEYTENTDHTNTSNYMLKFQDKVGNWLQARDTSWQTLVDSVQRVEIRRNNAFMLLSNL